MLKWLDRHVVLASFAVLALLLVLYLFANPPWPPATAKPGEGSVDIITSSISSPLGPKTDGEIAYYTIGENGRLLRAQAFVSDAFEVYKVSFSASALDNSVLPGGTVEDASGKPLALKDAWRGLLKKAALLPHHVIGMRILETRGLTFAIVEYNVNLWSPYLLLYYHAEEDRLVELAKLNSEDYVGIRVRNITALNGMR